MSYLLSVDPGTERMGLALFDAETKKLVLARLLRATEKTAFERVYRMGQMLDLTASELGAHKSYTLVMEYPQVHRHGPAAKADPDDILVLMAAFGAVLAKLPKASAMKFPRPGQWKGQVPKKIMCKRILEALSDVERALLKPLKEDHNAVDAVGLGLWALGRM